jgi:CDP-diacylglycerol--glycerol-3-phosphate 3-phosphatidyltransferase
MSAVELKLQDKIYQKTFLFLIPDRLHPNHLTMARFVLTPLVLWLTVQQYYASAIVSFLLVAFTDTLDGSLARVRNKITPWGKIYDPVADKLLIGSLVSVLVIQHLGFYLGLTIILIELVFIGLGWWWSSNGHVVQANRWGKVKMFLQVVGVTLLLVGLATGFEGLFGVSETTFYIAIFFALISLFTSGV